MKRLALVCCLLGCAEGDDNRFQVVMSTPADGDTVAADVEVALTFSEPHDVARCGESGVHLVVLSDDGQVARQPGFSVQQATLTQVLLQHDGLAPGTAYRLSVQTGVTGCLSGYGEGIRPFAADFTVE